MTSKSKRTRLIYFIVFFLVFIFVAPFILLYSFGYNWNKNFSVFKTGGIYVYASQTGVNVYIDNTLDDVTSVFQRGILVKDLHPKKYSLKVSKDGYLDWWKDIDVKEERVSEAYPFLIPKQVSATSVPAQILATNNTTGTPVVNSDYKNLITLFATSTKVVKVLSANVATSSKATSTFPSVESKKLVMEKRGNTLEAVWTGSAESLPFYFCSQDFKCVDEFAIYTADNIGTFDFYPSRNDVAIVAVGQKIFVVEMDKRNPQNIVELYQSSYQGQIDFRIVDNETIVVKEGKKLIKLSLVYAGTQ